MKYEYQKRPISNKSFEDRIYKLDKVLSKLKQKSKCRIFFRQNGLEYLGFRIIRQGIITSPDKEETVKNIRAPTAKKELRSFIGQINY